MFGTISIILGIMAGFQILIGVCIAYKNYGAAIFFKFCTIVFLAFLYLVGSAMGQDYADCGTTEVFYEGIGGHRIAYKKEQGTLIPCAKGSAHKE